MAATSLLTEVRDLGGWQGEWDQRLGKGRVQAGYLFQCSHPPVPLLFSAAPAVQSKTALGLWRRWHSKAEVSLLLQHSPVEQAGGLAGCSSPRELGPGLLPGHL